MNATERAALIQGVQLFDEMTASIDERTLEILDHRRRTAVVRRRGWLVRRALLLADLLGLAGAFLLAELVSGAATTGSDAVARSTEFILFVLTLPIWVVVAKLYGLYEHDEERTDHSTTDEFAGVFHMITVCTGLVTLGSYLTHLAHPTVGKVAVFWAAAVVLVSSGRAVARTCCRRHVSYLQNTVIVGAGEVGQLIGKKLLKHPEYGINLLGFVDDTPREQRADLEHLALLGPVERLPALVRFFDVERVVIAFSQDSHERMLDLIRSLKDQDVQIDIVPRLFELVGPSFDMHTVEGVPLLGLPPFRLSRSSRLLKRTFDLVLTIPGLVALVPVFAVIALLIKRDSSGPVFFRQLRMGCNGRTFRIWKFRTMAADADERKQEVAHLNQHLQNGGGSEDVQDPRRPARHSSRTVAAALLSRRAAAVVQRRARRDEPRGPATADPGRRSVRRSVGTAKAESQARLHGPVAGARAERNSLRRDGKARLPIRHWMVGLRRSEIGCTDDSHHVRC